MTTADLLTMGGGRRTRTDGFRWDVLDRALVKTGELHPSAEAQAVIDNNTNRSVKRTCSGLVATAADLAAFDPFADRLRPMYLAEDGTEWPLGVFVVVDRSTEQRRWGGLDMPLELADQAVALDQLLPASVGFMPGVPVATALAQVLAMGGVHDPAIDASSALVGAPVAWVAGRDRLISVVNDLAAMGGYFSVYFDNGGVCRLRRAPDLAGAPATFDFDAPPRVFPDTIIESDDQLAAPNRYVVIGSSGTDAPVVGAWDVPAEAPHSRANRGFFVVDSVDVQGLADAGQAAELARIRGQSHDRGYAWASFAAVPDPRIDTFEVVTWRGVKWRSQSWQWELRAGGEQRHQLRRVYGA